MTPFTPSLGDLPVPIDCNGPFRRALTLPEKRAWMNSVGDLGRRPEDRRRQLGLTAEEVAIRAGMSPTDIGVLESSPSPVVSAAALWRLRRSGNG
jgi:hypothetical protein